MINPHNPDFEHSPIHPSKKGYGYALGDLQSRALISIVTPFYNTGEVFHQTTQSIMGQSLQQFEWLIVNDGSDDPQAVQILEKYRHSDPRIRVIDHPENRGLSAARNTGFQEARTDYVLLLDSDDLLEPTAAEKWWWFLETHPQFAFVASYHVAFGGLNYLWTGGFHDGVQNTERNRVSMMCMIRKSVHQAVGGFDESIRGGLEDWEFWMRCAAQGIWGATIPEFLAWYRVRGDHSDRWENLNEDRIRQFRNLLQARYPDLYQGKFPVPQESVDLDLTQVTLEAPQGNLLQKAQPRLLLILPWMVMGGAERFALNLMDQLTRRGWQISVVTTSPSDNPWHHEFEQRTPDVFVLPNFLPIKDYPRFLRYLITSRQFDAVLLQGSIEGYRLLPVLRGLFPQLPILDYLHFVTPDWMDGGFPRLSLLYRDCIDLSLTSCHQVKQWMIAHGAAAERLGVCPINVDAERWRPNTLLRQQTRASLGIPPEGVVIVYAARLEPQKQPEIFIKSLTQLRQEGVWFYGIVAGEGSLRPALEAQLHEEGLEDCVHLLGAVEPGRMPAIMAAGDILFLPSQNEGIASVLYEGMACGLVPVGAHVGGQEELVTPECGILLPPLNGDEAVSAYAAALRHLILDPVRRQQMGAASRARILEHFTLDHMGACIEQSLRGAIRLKNQPSYAPISLPPDELLKREARHIVEHLQARQEYRQNEKKFAKLSDEYATLYNNYLMLVQPKPPSYWFYLWVRQLMLPLQARLKNTPLIHPFQQVKNWLKRLITGEKPSG